MKIALVSANVPLCGELAQEMARTASVEILTTCDLARGWGQGAFDPGLVRIGAVPCRRFRSDYPSVPGLEDRLTEAVRRDSPDLALETRWMQERGPYSSALLDYLETHAASYDALVFFELQSATTVFGLNRVAAPTVLVPRIEDWSLVRLDLFGAALRRASGLVFGSDEERRRVRDAHGGNGPSVLADGWAPEPYLEMVAQVCGGASKIDRP